MKNTILGVPRAIFGIGSLLGLVLLVWAVAVLVTQIELSYLPILVIAVSVIALFMRLIRCDSRPRLPLEYWPRLASRINEYLADKAKIKGYSVVPSMLLADGPRDASVTSDDTDLPCAPDLSLYVSTESGSIVELYTCLTDFFGELEVAEIRNLSHHDYDGRSWAEFTVVQSPSPWYSLYVRVSKCRSVAKHFRITISTVRRK